MGRNTILLVIIGALAVLLLTGAVTPLLGGFQKWLNESHSVSGLVIVIGALVLVLVTKILWR